MKLKSRRNTSNTSYKEAAKVGLLALKWEYPIISGVRVSCSYSISPRILCILSTGAQNMGLVLPIFSGLGSVYL
jgi:hypothetical protein